MSEQKQSHEVEGIVRRPPRQECVDAQIWGRESKHFCSFEGPKHWDRSPVNRTVVNHAAPCVTITDFRETTNVGILYRFNSLYESLNSC